MKPTSSTGIHLIHDRRVFSRMNVIGRLCLTAFLVLLLAATAAAQAPDAATLVGKTKAALEPDRSSTRAIAVDIKQGSSEAVVWRGAQARDKLKGTSYILTVILSPAEARGLASLARQADSHQPLMWTYVPAVHRVEQLTPESEFAPMFGSDFTFADVGFINPKARYRYLGESQRDGIKSYTLELRPQHNPFYTKIIAWISQKTFLPVERDFYDYSPHPIDIETYGEVKDIQGTPTVTRIKMTNQHSGNSTEFDFSHIVYERHPPAALFNPAKLPGMANQEYWKTINHD